MIRARAQRGDTGETLVEVLVAVAILGLAGVAVLAGMGLAAKASNIHRKETTGSAQVSAYAEDIQRYVTNNPSAWDCANAGTAYSPATVGFGTPTGFNDPTYSATPLSQNAAGQVVTGSCSPDSGLQLLTLSLASTDGGATEHATFVLRRPCDTSVATTCP